MDVAEGKPDDARDPSDDQAAHGAGLGCQFPLWSPRRTRLRQAVLHIFADVLLVAAPASSRAAGEHEWLRRLTAAPEMAWVYSRSLAVRRHPPARFERRAQPRQHAPWLL